MVGYPATLTADDEGYIVTFRDIPEAITQGDTKEEALAHAKNALETALEFYFEDRREVPEPSAPLVGEHMVTVSISAAHHR